MDNRSGCLVGFLKLFLLDKLFDWLQKSFGFGRGCSGCGCGVILVILFIVIAGSIIFGTDWFSFF
jgi:hypothetical protein